MATKLAHVVGLGLITPGSRTPVESCKLSELISELEAEQFRFTYQQRTETQRLHLIDENGDYVAIKLAPKVKLKSTNPLKMFFELLTGYVVYYGVINVEEKNEKGELEQRERAWFTLSVEASLDETEIFDIAEAMPKEEKKGKTNKIRDAVGG